MTTNTFDIEDQAGRKLYEVTLPLETLGSLPTIIILPSGTVAQRYRGRYAIEDAYYTAHKEIKTITD